MSEQHNERPDLAWDLVDRLNKSMRVSGHSTGTLAAALDVHRNTISNYTSGRVRPDRRTIMSWALACGVPVEWLTGAGSPGPDGLPRLDSNQEPSGYVSSQVRALSLAVA